VPTDLAGAGCEIEGQHAEDEGKRCHQDRAQAQLGCLNRRICDGSPLLDQLFGKFYDEN